MPFADGGFKTPSGSASSISEALAAQGLDPLPAYVAVRRRIRSARTEVASTLSPSSPRRRPGTSTTRATPASLASARPRASRVSRCTPRTPRHAGIRDGESVRAFNQRGSMTLRAQGTGRDTARASCRSRRASGPSLLPGGSSANALTPDGLSDHGGGGDFHDARVEVERARAWPPRNDEPGALRPRAMRMLRLAESSERA